MTESPGDFQSAASAHALGRAEFEHQPFPSSLQHFGSRGHKPCWFSKPGILGGFLPGEVLKAGAPDVGSEPLTP